MRTLTLADLIGLGVVLFIMEVLQRDLGDDKYRPAPLLRKMVAAGWLGAKPGEGFINIRKCRHPRPNRLRMSLYPGFPIWESGFEKCDVCQFSM
jgi:3-hydroxyacyl-CoA dehydrogenase